MENIQEQFHQLITVYGQEKVRAMAQKLLNANTRPIPAEHFPVLSPQALEDTLKQLSFVRQEITDATNYRGAVDNSKGELVLQKFQLETAMKLTESEAFMNTWEEGNKQYGSINDKKIALNNDTNRDAYRRSYSATERKELAEVCGEIDAVDVDIKRADASLQATFERGRALTAKASLQAALLNYLARG